MNTFRNRALALSAALALAVTGLAGCDGTDEKASSSKGTELVGIVKLAPGSFEDGKLSGTWFRMVQLGGTVAKGPFMVNGNSQADGGKATLLAPGTSGGLRLGGYQSQPKPAFDKRGNSLAAAITKPVKFFAVEFSIATNTVDPQTQTEVAPPTVYVKDGKLTADMSSWGVTWNNQVFNQGAPKPVSSTQAKAVGQEDAEKVWDWVAGKYLEKAPAPTISGKGATGTYDAKTGKFVLQWTSLIKGGPFNGFTGAWHLEGTFTQDAKAPGGTS
ncbi:hypothetical protein ABIE44_001457 [Marmoricola sp. OAE513]|uniref:hypothetical protein n=1 Tax=Marmoricola sp. OAE513 TaxID=2817894 RepID=UPI001AE7ECCD